MRQILFSIFAVLTLISCSPRLAKEVRTYENGEISRIEYFDIHSNIVERLFIKGGTLVLKEEYIIIDNKLHKATFSQGNDVVYTIENTYENGNLVRTRYVSGGKVQTLIVYRYDENQRLYSESHFDIFRSLRKTIFYHYDQNNRLIASIIISQDDSLFTQKFYIYDQSGISKEITIYGGDTLQLVEYKYKKDLLTDKIIIENKVPAVHLKYTYNVHRKPKRIIHLDDNGFIVRQEEIRYNRYGYEKLRKITDYRVFDGKNKKQTDVITYKYQYF